MSNDYAYEQVRRVVYGDEGATFVPVCAGADGKGGCGRFLRTPSTILIRLDGRLMEPHATCSRCGRVQMLFEGYV